MLDLFYDEVGKSYEWGYRRGRGDVGYVQYHGWTFGGGGLSFRWVSIFAHYSLLVLIFFVCKGEYKTILQLVGVLSHGKIAKRLTDRAIDLMQDVQNLRKAIYEFVLSHFASLSLIWFFWGFSYKLKVDACEKGSSKERKLRNITVNYLYVCSLFFVPLHFIWWEIGIDMVRWSFSPIIWLRGGNRGKVRRRRSLNGFVSIGKLPSYLGGGHWTSLYRIAGWRFNGLSMCIWYDQNLWPFNCYLPDRLWMLLGGSICIPTH